MDESDVSEDVAVEESENSAKMIKARQLGLFDIGKAVELHSKYNVGDVIVYVGILEYFNAMLVESDELSYALYFKGRAEPVVVDGEQTVFVGD